MKDLLTVLVSFFKIYVTLAPPVLSLLDGRMDVGCAGASRYGCEPRMGVYFLSTSISSNDITRIETS